MVSKGRAPTSPRKSTAPIPLSPPAPRIGATLIESFVEIGALLIPVLTSLPLDGDRCRIADLYPCGVRTRSVRRIHPLRNDALDAKLAGRCEHERTHPRRCAR